MDQSRLITLGWGVEGSYIGRLHYFQGNRRGEFVVANSVCKGGGPLKKCKMVSVFTSGYVNTREVGRRRDKRRKPRHEVEWFPAYRKEILGKSSSSITVLKKKLKETELLLNK